MLCFLLVLSVHRMDQSGNGPEVWGTVRLNGTAVPEDITFRPFSTNFAGYSFGGLVAGHFRER